MKHQQILGNNGFTEGLKPRLVKQPYLSRNTLRGRSRVRIFDFPGTQLMSGELDDSEYLDLKIINTLINNFCGDEGEVGELAITDDSVVLFVKPVGATCNCCHD